MRIFYDEIFDVRFKVKFHYAMFCGNSIFNRIFLHCILNYGKAIG